MGLRRRYIKYINHFIKNEFDKFQNLDMLELGNQIVRRNDFTKKKTGKEYFSSLGINHTSIDMNGLDGSIKHDLSKKIIVPEWIGHFNIITNLGTSEHVEPFKSQYDCFKNIHNFCSSSGIMIHIVPDALEFERRNAFKLFHCNNYYTKEFFEILAKENKYYMLNMRVIKAYRYVCLKKIKRKEFMYNNELFLSKIIRKEGAKIYKFEYNNA